MRNTSWFGTICATSISLAIVLFAITEQNAPQTNDASFCSGAIEYASERVQPPLKQQFQSVAIRLKNTKGYNKALHDKGYDAMFDAELHGDSDKAKRIGHDCLKHFQ